MQVCTKCDGKGSRTVELSTGEKIAKTCYVCKGQGILEGIPGSTVVRSQPKQSPPELPKPMQRPPIQSFPKSPIQNLTPLSVPLGDLSFLGSKRQVYG